METLYPYLMIPYSDFFDYEQLLPKLIPLPLYELFCVASNNAKSLVFYYFPTAVIVTLLLLTTLSVLLIGLTIIIWKIGMFKNYFGKLINRQHTEVKVQQQERIEVMAVSRPSRGERNLIHDNEVEDGLPQSRRDFRYPQMHWTVHNTGGPRRVNHAAVTVNGVIYSFGGYCTGENYSIQRPIDVFVLNPVSYRWRLLPLEPTALTPFQRYGHTAVAYGRFVYLWGGRNDDNACKILYRFDTKSLKWEKPETTGCIPGARDGHSAVVIRGKMYVFGGYEEAIGLFSQDVHSLDLETLTWSYVPTAGQAPSFRDFHTATVYLDRYMFIFGGRGDENGPFHTRAEMYCNTLVCFDVERHEWFRPKTTGNKPKGRRSHSAFMHSGFMYVFGGYCGISDTHFNDLFRYDPETADWQKVVPFGHGPAPRRRQGCCVLENRVFFFGGTSPITTNIHMNPHQPNGDEETEELNLTDHDDMFVLDMEPSLKTLCILKISQCSMDSSCLPNVLKQEIYYMTTPNKINFPLTSG